MSRVRLYAEVNDDAAELVNVLTHEFQNPQPGNEQPLVSIETPGDMTHLMVVWDRWRNLSQRERSEIIMDAYEMASGRDAAVRVSVAMGLTATEAQRLGYSFIPA